MLGLKPLQADLERLDRCRLRVRPRRRLRQLGGAELAHGARPFGLEQRLAAALAFEPGEVVELGQARAGGGVVAGERRLLELQLLRRAGPAAGPLQLQRAVPDDVAALGLATVDLL